MENGYYFSVDFMILLLLSYILINAMLHCSRQLLKIRTKPWDQKTIKARFLKCFKEAISVDICWKVSLKLHQLKRSKKTYSLYQVLLGKMRMVN